MDKEQLVQFLKDKSALLTIKSKGKTYSINGSDFLCSKKIQNYLFRIHNITIDITILEQVLAEYSSKVYVLEKEIRDKLAKQLNGTIEVKTEAGYIDVLTLTEVIEVKKFSGWKSAIGQVIAYSKYYPEHQARIHLYGEITKNNFDTIYKLCKDNNIKLSYESS